MRTHQVTWAFGLGLVAAAAVVGFGVARTEAQPPAEPAQAMCQRVLAVGRVSVRAGCQIDERVSGRSAVVAYPCAGGRASAAFGASVFQGEVDARGNVSLVIETRFPFSDGCTWETKQRISGQLGAGRLDYEYREQPLPDQRGCANGCLGTATVQVR